MDAQDRNDFGNRQEFLARRLGQALDQLKPREAADCPDAQVIAAYAEHALAVDESAHWEGHFAACERCRNILRVLAASADMPLAEEEVAQLGQRVSASRVPAAVEISVASAQRVLPSLRRRRRTWLAPAFAVAAVLAVWIAVRAPWRASDRGASTALIAQAPRQEIPASPATAPADQLSDGARQQNQELEPAPSAGQSGGKTLPPNSLAGAPAKESADAAPALDKVSPNSGVASGSLQQGKKLNALAAGSRQIQSPAGPAPPPPQTSQAQGAMNATPSSPPPAKPSSNSIAPESAPSAAKADALAGPTAPGKQAATIQSQTGATLGGVARQKATSDLRAAAQNEQAPSAITSAQDYSSLLKAPSSSILWRAGIAGMIERSNDAGKTWVSHSSPSREDWLAGAAVSRTLCWIAGRNGAIARTTDGENWQRITPPIIFTGADGRLPDWISIAARDALSATIVASDGRRFATADGGKTWQAQ